MELETWLYLQLFLYSLVSSSLCLKLVSHYDVLAMGISIQGKAYISKFRKRKRKFSLQTWKVTGKWVLKRGHLIVFWKFLWWPYPFAWRFRYYESSVSSWASPGLWCWLMAGKTIFFIYSSPLIVPGWLTDGLSDVSIAHRFSSTRKVSPFRQMLKEAVQVLPSCPCLFLMSHVMKWQRPYHNMWRQRLDIELPQYGDMCIAVHSFERLAVRGQVEGSAEDGGVRSTRMVKETELIIFVRLQFRIVASTVITEGWFRRIAHGMNLLSLLFCFRHCSNIRIFSCHKLLTSNCYWGVRVPGLQNPSNKASFQQQF